MAERAVWFRTWVARQWLGLLLAGIALLVVFDVTDLDIWISNLFYDDVQKNFPWKEKVWFERIFHVGLKNLMLWSGVLTALGMLVWGVRRRTLSLRQWGLCVAAMVFIPLGIVLLKWMTHRSCPWSLDLYGGPVHYTGLLAQLFDPNAHDAGQCFPAGHSAGGYMWLGWALAVWKTHTYWRKAFLWMGLFAGTFLGLTRVMQGAHFVSHVLWSGWFAWAIALLLAWLFRLEPVATNSRN